jgi:hypothetical protein
LVSTNGLLLSERTVAALVEAGIKNLQITLHTLQSCIAYKTAADFLRRNALTRSDIEFCGNVLSSNRRVTAWIDSIKVGAEDRVYLRPVSTHTCAGNVPGMKADFEDTIVSGRMSRCIFLRDNKCSIRWDGTVVSCCFDSENDNVLGKVDDFPRLRHVPAQYGLCKHCDANWANGGT